MKICATSFLLKNVLLHEKKPDIGNSVEPSAQIFCAEGSTRWPSTQYFRSILQVIYQFSREDRSLLQGDIRVGGILIPLFEQQPGFLAQSWLLDEGELPAQFFAEEQKTQCSAVQLFPDLLLHGISGFPHQGSVVPPIPDNDLPCTIGALSDHPLERSILQWVVFHHQCQPFHFGIQRGTFGYRPAFQDAIKFQPEIIMQAGSLVLLHDEDERALHASPPLQFLLAGTDPSL